LAVLPTHRLVSGLPDLTPEELSKMLGSHFELEAMGTGADAAQQTWELIDADGGQDVFGFATAADDQWIFARVSDTSPMQTLANDKSESWRNLGVSVLHKLVLEHLLQKQAPNAQPTCKYVHTLGEVVEAQSEKTCQLSCLVPPAGIEHVEEIASHYEKMPAKSTYFYPKLLSGLVFHSLK